MAQFLIMFRVPRHDMVWRACLISTIFMFCICSGAAAFGHDRASSCQKDLCQNPNSSQQTQSKKIDEAVLGLDDSEKLQRVLSLHQGTFEAQEGPFNASNGDISNRRVWISAAGPMSKTECEDVYFANVHFALSVHGARGFAVEGRKRNNDLLMNLHVHSQIRGVYSNRTGRFCATFCVGEPANTRQHYMTPARMAYKVENPESISFPDSLVGKDCKIHMEVEFPFATTFTMSSAKGMMTSLRSEDDPSYFHPLTIFGMSMAPYKFNTSVQFDAHILGASAKPDISSGMQDRLKVWSQGPPFCPTDRKVNQYFSAPLIYSFTWSPSCGSSGGVLCNPFQSVNLSQIDVTLLTMKNVQCSPDWKIRVAFVFEFIHTTMGQPELNASESSLSRSPIFVTQFLVSAEGYWDFSKPGQLVMVANYVDTDGTSLDSKILITLQLPMARTLFHRRGVIGHVRSTREELDPLYFAPFSFAGDLDLSMMSDFGRSSAFLRAPELSYDYDNGIRGKIKPLCSLDAGAHKVEKNARFPDGSRALDFEVDFAPFNITGLVNSSAENSSRWSYLQNVAIGQEFREQQTVGFAGKNYNSNNGEPKVHSLHPSDIPVSFTLILFRQHTVPMEGFYDSTNGHMCLLGCRRWEEVAQPYEKDEIEDLVSKCDWVLSIQYPSTNPRLWAKNKTVTATLRSVHDADHPLYFEPLALHSANPISYSIHKRWTFLRRHAETIMSLASLSLVTFFTAIQVGYSSRQSNFRNLRFVSFVMLTVFTSGHFFPLVLSFNAFWTKTLPTVQGYSSSFYSFDVYGWPEAHEVIVRGTSMVALLLEMRLLQLVWRSRKRANNNSPSQAETDSAPSKVSDGPIWRTCLPIYGAMIAVVACVHWQMGPHQKVARYFDVMTVWALVWADLQAFSGVILDVFLLPQVIANFLWDTQEKVAPLYPLFYLGMTAVRSVQHLFDVARAWNSIPEFDFSSYYYANPNWDLYSTTWDFVIPCLSVLLAVMLFLQQRYGGRCLVPKRLRRQKYQLLDFQRIDL